LLIKTQIQLGPILCSPKTSINIAFLGSRRLAWGSGWVWDGYLSAPYRERGFGKNDFFT